MLMPYFQCNTCCSRIFSIQWALFCMFIEAIPFLAVYGFTAVNLKIVFLPLLAFEIIILIDNFRYLLIIVFTALNVAYIEIFCIVTVYLLLSDAAVFYWFSLWFESFLTFVHVRIMITWSELSCVDLTFNSLTLSPHMSELNDWHVCYCAGSHLNLTKLMLILAWDHFDKIHFKVSEFEPIILINSLFL